MKVRNMISPRSGRPIPNQFRILTDEATYFQSYNVIIIKIDHASGKVYLDINYWNCSQTTGKYRNQFLGELKRETEAKIKSGEYILANLNR